VRRGSRLEDLCPLLGVLTEAVVVLRSDIQENVGIGHAATLRESAAADIRGHH
jgi:hypothetical protein